jgi:hypothetical protein
MGIDKKLFSVILLLIILVAIFSGCIGGPTNKTKSNENIITNEPPVAVINAPEFAYIGDEITFDASKSYDPDGTIISYSWDFGDGVRGEGKKVKHVYNPKDVFAPEYPLFIPVTLTIEDDKGSFDWAIFEISLMPKNYIFYLSENSLDMDKPSEGSTSVKATMGIIRSKVELVYNLDNPIPIPTCTWNATVYIEKTHFALLSGITIVAFNETGSEIGYLEGTGKLTGSLGKTTVVYEMSGSFSENVLSGIKITIKGFSIRNSISIVYGGEKASKICFDLT